MSIELKQFAARLIQEGNSETSVGKIRVIGCGTVKSGTILVSEWMETGMNSRPVYAEVVAEDMPEDNEVLTFGKTDLFEAAGFETFVPSVKTSVQIAENYGKFRVALKFRESCVDPEFLLHYVIFGGKQETAGRRKTILLPDSQKTADPANEESSFSGVPGQTEELSAPGDEAEPQEKEETADTPDPQSPFFIANPPKILHPGMKYVLRTNMDPHTCTISWKTGKNGGFINHYGEFTAPDKPGMYEAAALWVEAGREASVYIVVR